MNNNVDSLILKAENKTYELFKNFPLGKGTFGEVYAGKNRSGSLVAIKVISKYSVEGNEKNLYFEQEIEVSKAIMSLLQNEDHENILHIFDILDYDSENNNTPQNNKYARYIISEYCNSKSLYSYMQSKEFNFTEDEVIDIALQIVKGVDYIHKNNFMHRDLKPENILIKEEMQIQPLEFSVNQTKQGEKRKVIKIGDFGIMQSTRDILFKSQIGTINYMSPDIFLNKSYGKEVDFWSFGIIILELFTGRQNWFIDEIIKLKNNYENSDQKLDILSVILKCLHFDLNLRYKNACEIINDLNTLKQNNQQNINNTNEQSKQQIIGKVFRMSTSQSRFIKNSIQLSLNSYNKNVQNEVDEDKMIEQYENAFNLIKEYQQKMYFQLFTGYSFLDIIKYIKDINFFQIFEFNFYCIYMIELAIEDLTQSQKNKIKYQDFFLIGTFSISRGSVYSKINNSPQLKKLNTEIRLLKDNYHGIFMQQNTNSNSLLQQDNQIQHSIQLKSQQKEKNKYNIEECFKRYRQYKCKQKIKKRYFWNKEKYINEEMTKYQIFLQLVINKIYNFKDLEYFFLFIMQYTLIQQTARVNSIIKPDQISLELPNDVYPQVCILFSQMLLKYLRTMNQNQNNSQNSNNKQIINSLVIFFIQSLDNNSDLYTDLYKFVKDFIKPIKKDKKDTYYTFLDQKIYDLRDKQIEIDDSDPFNKIFFYIKDGTGHILISDKQESIFFQRNISKTEQDYEFIKNNIEYR